MWRSGQVSQDWGTAPFGLREVSKDKPHIHKHEKVQIRINIIIMSFGNQTELRRVKSTFQS
jgi:hypothetical protein